MNTTRWLMTVLAATVSLGSLPALAQPANGARDELRQPGAGKGRAAARDLRLQRIERERQVERHEYFNARGPAFRPGLRLPPLFRHPSYVVVNYRLHHLPPPPRGHQWVQVGPDYVLVVIGSGVIVRVVLGL